MYWLGFHGVSYLSYFNGDYRSFAHFLLVIWKLFCVWQDLPFPSFVSIDSIMWWVDSDKLNVTLKKCFNTVCIATFWLLWKFCNTMFCLEQSSLRKQTFLTTLFLILFGFVINIKSVRWFELVGWTIFMQLSLFCNLFSCLI